MPRARFMSLRLTRLAESSRLQLELVRRAFSESVADELPPQPAWKDRSH